MLRTIVRALVAVALTAAFACSGDIVGSPPDDEASLQLGGSHCIPEHNPYNCRPPAPAGDAPRIKNPATGNLNWPLAAGTALLDGRGGTRGVVADSAVKINYGQRKILGGEIVVYVWSARLTSGEAASGWVRAGALVHAALLAARMPTLALPDPGEGEYQTQWLVTGGDPGSFGDLKVTKGWAGGGRNATDYLLRGGNVVNLVYNVPGYGLGGFSVDTFTRGVVFRRVKGVVQFTIPLYQPGSHTASASMRFVYGYIHDGSQSRFGWIAKEALVAGGSGVVDEPADSSGPGDTGGGDPGGGDPGGGDTGGDSGGDPGGGDPGGGTPPPPVSGTCAIRCCDDSLAIFATATADECRAAYAVCTTHDRVLRMRFNDALIYERSTPCATYCCAKCWNRERYHQVVGVTSGCTDAARSYCSASDRGGLEDADWRYCEP